MLENDDVKDWSLNTINTSNSNKYAFEDMNDIDW